MPHPLLAPLVLLGQVSPEAMDRIAQGGTRGLIYALTGALVAVCLGGAWLLRQHLGTAARFQESMQAVQAEHTRTLREVQTAHAREILTVQQSSATALTALTERVTTTMGDIHGVARDLRDAVDSVAEMARTLERTLDRGGFGYYDGPGQGSSPHAHDPRPPLRHPTPVPPPRRRAAKDAP